MTTCLDANLLTTSTLSMRGRSRFHSFLLTLVAITVTTAGLQAQDWDAANRKWKVEIEQYLIAMKDRDAARILATEAQAKIDKSTTVVDGKGTIHMAQGELDRLKAVIAENSSLARAKQMTMDQSVTAALAALKDFDSKEAVKAVATVAGVVDDAKLVYEACAILESMGGRKSLDEMVAQLKSTKNTLVVRTFCRALWRSTESSDRAAVIDAMKDKDDNKVISALDAITIAEAGAAFDRAIELLAHDTWQVRVSALGLLARSIGETNEEKIVQAVIARLGSEEGRVRTDFHSFLSKRMNGASGGDDPERWAQIWDNFKHDREHGELGDPGATVSTYYGIPIYSKHIVFVLDTSGSMAEPHNIVRQPVAPKSKAVETEDGSSTAKKEDQPKAERKELDWANIHTKIELAKAELIRTLEELEEDVNFGIVTYNTNFTVLSENLELATPANKKKYIDMISGLAAAGSTCAFFTAQFAGMDCTVKGPRAKPNAAKGQVDLKVIDANTIFFLTDGFPTINGGGAGGNMPQDVKENHLLELQRRFETKKVCINTIGIGPHDNGLLRRIADMTGGTYVDLSR